MIKMLSGVRRKCRGLTKRAIAVGVLFGFFLICYSYMNLEFCYKIMAKRTLNKMCLKYRRQEYNGVLCEDLCGDMEAYKNFKCPQTDMRSTVFTAEKNGDVYAIKLARKVKDKLGWTNKEGEKIYPSVEEFQRIIKMHISLNYNMTIDDNMIKALINQDIDPNVPEQMLSFWRLFKDNNFVMSKLYDEESIFPTVLGTCGPYYATENLQIVTDPGLIQYISFEWRDRLKMAMNIMEYVFRLDEIKPEPLKMCKMKLTRFGFNSDKRMKYQSAEYVYVESELDKQLANGERCTEHSDCNVFDCMGECDAEKSICTGKQQNNNLQIFCDYLLRGGSLSPGILASSKTPQSLITLVNNCIDPTATVGYQVVGRKYAPNTELALRLYNEMKRVYRLAPPPPPPPPPPSQTQQGHNNKDDDGDTDMDTDTDTDDEDH